jgi:uracil-DNA glycosylase
VTEVTAKPSRYSGVHNRGLARLAAEVESCRKCPRLVEWRESVAADPPRRYRGERYWARPVPGFGDPAARLVVIGLAPAAHGGNRTGRVFTGDRSGDWLFAALHRAGFANQALSVHRDDGLELRGAWISAAVRCAPPANKPTPLERDTCAPWLRAEADLLWPTVRAVVALGRFAQDAVLRLVRESGGTVPRPGPRFGHGVETTLGRPGGGDLVLVASFHPSQQNTFTGRLTMPMLTAVLQRAAAIGGAGGA